MDYVEYFLWQILLAIGLIFLFRWLVNRLNLNQNKYLRMFFAYFALHFLCCALAVGNGFLSHESFNTVELLRKPVDQKEISENWGSQFSPEERAKYSLALARSIYINKGLISGHVDMTGKLIQFSPDTNDQIDRTTRLSEIKKKAKFTVLSCFAVFFWLFIPILGIRPLKISK